MANFGNQVERLGKLAGVINPAGNTTNVQINNTRIGADTKSLRDEVIAMAGLDRTEMAVNLIAQDEDDITDVEVINA